MKTLLHTTLATCISFTALSSHAADAKADIQQDSKKQPSSEALAADEMPVQLAILLDTSGSMDGLIEQAKTQLWKIVNEFNGAKQDGKKPVVQVALYEYGNQNLSAGTNYIRQVLPLTRDLDRVSQELFKLTTNGGEEYCGAVIQDALDRLEWDSRAKVYKAIFIAGNEPFTQGPIEPNPCCKAAQNKGIIINTIHCGPRAEGESTGWHTGASLADGKFLIIDQDKAVAHIDAPQDKEIGRLSLELNKTYIIYGKEGSLGASRQAKQDQNAEAYKTAGSSVQRAVAKASTSYSNRSWDLVDATRPGAKPLTEIAENDLPEELRKLKPEERQTYVEAKAKERTQIQTQIQKLNEARVLYVADELKKKGQEATLDNAISSTVREQAAAKSVQFK
jgi:von Willebrand factor type A domain